MNIGLQNLTEISALYNINETITNFSFFINWYDDKVPEMKAITSVMDSGK